MLVQRPSDFRMPFDPALLLDRRPFKPELTDAEARIALLRLGEAHRDVMLDSDKRGWFCLAVEPGHETEVNGRLGTFNVNTFLPMENDHIVCRRGRKKIVEGGPIHAGYVLVECANVMRAFLGIEALRYVYRVLGGAASPWRIKDKVINDYKELIAADHTDVEASPELDNVIRIGDEVLITKGPWVDCRGEIVQAGRHKAKVKIALYAESCDVSMPLAYFRKL